MKIQLAKQSIGKRRPVYVEYEILEGVETLKDFIINVVTQEVEAFCAPSTEPKPLPEDAIWVSSKVGKVGFGVKYNDTLPVLEEGIEVALQGFQDGLYKVFLDAEELQSLDAKMTLTPESQVTLVRLVMLSGRLF